MDGDADRPLTLAATHVLGIWRFDHGGNQGGDPEHTLRCRHGVEHLASDRSLLRRALYVHQRRGARDGDRLLELTDFELGVHLSGEAGPKLETLVPERGEARERERQGVQ